MSSAPEVRLPYVVREDGVPIQQVVRYLVRERLFHCDNGTMRNDAIAIAHFFRWATEDGIDLEARLENEGEILSRAEIRKLAQWLRIKRSDGEEELRCNKPSTVNLHLGRIGAFVAWSVRYRCEFSTNEALVADAHKRAGFVRDMFASCSLPTGIPTGDQKEGLPPAQLSELLAVTNPEHEKNPFTKRTALANQVLIHFLLETGMRVGEALAMRMEDVNTATNTPSVFVVVRENPDDPRSLPPAAKTQGREIPISPNMARMLVYYERRVRLRTRTPFFFVTPTRRTPLTIRHAQKACERLSKAVGFDLSPHVLRYTFNDQFYRVGRRMQWDENNAKAYHTVISGWASNSEMPEHYARREIRETAIAAARQWQSTLYTT